MKPQLTHKLLLYWAVLISTCSTLSCSSPVNEHTKKLLSHIPADTGYLFHLNVDTKSPFAKEAARLFQEQSALLRPKRPEFLPIHNIYKSITEHIQSGQMDKIGFSNQFKIALYGMWVWPVIIHEISNKERYIEWLSESSGSEISPDPSKPNIYRFKDLVDFPFYPIIGFSSNQVAQIAMVHAETEAVVIPYLNGQKKHQQSLHKEGSVQHLAESVQIVGDPLFFWIDIVKIYKMITNPKGLHIELHTKEIAKNLDRSNTTENHCDREIWGLLTKIQTLIGGNQEGMNLRLLAKLDPKLAAHLNKITAHDVLTVTPQDGLLGISFALNVKGVLEVAQTFIQETLDRPYKCKRLKRALKPQALRKVQQQLTMLPPFAKDLQGVSVQIYDAELNLAAPKANAALIVSAKQAQKLIQIAQAFVPILAQLKLPEVGKGMKELSGLPIPVGLQPIYSQLETNGLGIALGEKGKLKLKESLIAPKKGPAPLLRISYDLEGFTKLFGALFPAQINQRTGSATSMADHITIEFGFNKSGLLIETRSKLKRQTNNNK